MLPWAKRATVKSDWLDMRDWSDLRGSAWGAVLAFCLVFAQTLGMLHGTVHNANFNNSHELQAAPSSPSHRQVATLSDGTRRTTLAQLLFADHQTESDCLVYDQLNHCDAAPTLAALALPLVVQAFLLSLLSGLAVARWHALFQARGPPLPR